MRTDIYFYSLPYIPRNILPPRGLDTGVKVLEMEQALQQLAEFLRCNPQLIVDLLDNMEKKDKGKDKGKPPSPLMAVAWLTKRLLRGYPRQERKGPSQWKSGGTRRQLVWYISPHTTLSMCAFG
jgi:hypothetical protein